jgi:polyisoprenoid-binding protein YceI
MTNETMPPGEAFVADPIHSSVNFSIRSVGISTFRGSFAKPQVTLETSQTGDPTLLGRIPVETISIVDPPEFRAHLLSDAFLAAESHPEISFSSKTVELAGDGPARVTGTLTLRGETREVEAHGSWVPPTPDPSGKTRIHLSLEATIDRREFGMTWNSPLPNGGDALGWEINVSVELALLSKA